MIAPALAALAGVMAVLHLATVLLALRRMTRVDARPGDIGRPWVTLVRPVCGLDPFDAETLGSSFRQDYPGYDVIFCAATRDDPAVAVVERLIAANPQVPAQVLFGEAPDLRNPKLRNVAKGWQAARGRWLCMTDSNLMLPPDYLATVVGSWRRGTGLVSSPPVGERPQGWGGHLECAFLNTNQARLQLASDMLGFGFAQGKTLFFDRDLVDPVGGLAALDRNLAEDVNATRLVRGLGLSVSLTPRPFAQPIGSRRLRQVWDRQLRWARVRREGFPVLFLFEPLNGAVIPVAACAGACALGGAPLALTLIFAGLWYAAEAVLARAAGWPSGPRDILSLPLRDLLMPAIWGAALVGRSFDWRGNRVGPAPVAMADPGHDPVRT